MLAMLIHLMVPEYFYDLMPVLEKDYMIANLILPGLQKLKNEKKYNRNRNKHIVRHQVAFH